MNTLHPHVRTLVIGLYVAVVSQAIAPLIAMFFHYVPYIIVPFSFQVSNITAVVLALFIEEAIRKSKYSRRTKIMLACGVATLAALGYVAFWGWVFRWFGF